MRIPKEIREKVELRNKLNEDIRNWFIGQGVDLDGMFTDESYICDKDNIEGESQGDGEICDQTQFGEDSFSGTHYWECDNGQYLAMHFYF